MTWFTASIVTAIKRNEGEQETIPVFEDFYLLEARTRTEALEQARSIGKELENLDDALTVSGQPASRIFLGVRKLRAVYNDRPGDYPDTAPPSHRTELTHSFYEVATWETATELGQGKRVDVSYSDDAES